NGFCEAKCWQVTETVNYVEFREGDATRAKVKYKYINNAFNWGNVTYGEYSITGCGIDGLNHNICGDGDLKKDCTIIKINNPVCVSSNEIQCPVGCPIFVNLNKTTPKGIDRCADRQWYGGVKWHERDLYACRNDQKVLRCYDSPCQSTLGSTSLDGRMDASGKCVKNSSMPSGGSSGGGGTIGGDIINDDYQNQDFIDQQKMIQE
ncbi:MAG: hypothetical protein WCZ15_02235, partial [Patescibacteria group bacterium]